MTSTSSQSTRDTTVVVVYGGRSSERDVSLASGAAVATALCDASDGRGPARVVTVEITANGVWMLEGEQHSPDEALSRLPREAVYFLALHGGEGEDGTIQGLLAATGRAHTGSGVAASAVCMTKSWTRAVLAQAGLRVASGLVIDAAQWGKDRGALLERARGLSSSGFAVKPDRGGSSVATFVLDDAAGLEISIEKVLATGDRALVEARVVGPECTVGVLGNRGRATALMPVEIVPKDGRFFDYEEKYSAGGASEHCPPRGIDASVCAVLRELAERAHTAADCEGQSRVDFIVPRGGGEPVVLEINTLPGMTARSLLPLAAAHAGLTYRDLCLHLVHLARERAEAVR